MGERNEYEHSLAEDLVPLVFRHELDCPAVVEPVREFDQHNPDIIIHCQENTLEILRLDAAFLLQVVLAAVLVVQHILDLGQTVDQRSDLRAEKISDVFYGVVRILHDIVQKSRHDRLVAQTDVIDHDVGDGNRMNDVRISGTAPHILVGFIRKIESLPDNRKLFFIGASFLRRVKKFRITFADHLIIFLCELRDAHISSTCL